MNNYKPQGYNSVSTYLVVKDSKQVIEFLRRTFDAEVTRKYEGPDGKLFHGEVRIDDSIVMLADATEAYQAYPSHLHVYVKDVDETYRRALAAGGQSVQAPLQKEDPDKRGGVKDSSGNTWWIATQTRAGH